MISRALFGDLLPIPILDIPPPIKYKFFLSSILVPICDIGVVED